MKSINLPKFYHSFAAIVTGIDEFESENAVVFGCFDIHDKFNMLSLVEHEKNSFITLVHSKKESYSLLHKGLPHDFQAYIRVSRDLFNLHTDFHLYC